MSETKVAQAVIKKRKWPYPLIWFVPLVVALMAGFYFKKFMAQNGPMIVIRFEDASGLVVGETRLLYRGAEVGRVTAITLSDDRKHALVHARLKKREDIFATQGADYWIVRPEISQSGFHGLDTLMTGPYIHAGPGAGTTVLKEFNGYDKEPTYEEGVRFVLTSPRLGHIQEGSVIYYKGIPVGSVHEIALAKDASHIDAHILVWSEYAHLVRQNTKFWVDSGFDFKGGIFSGIHVTLESLKTIVSGGVAFATPDKDMQPVAKSGTVFALADDPKKDWEEWSPHVKLASSTNTEEQKPVRLPAAKREKKK